MTLEELEIVVDASVQKAIKEFNKLLPAIKKQTNKIQEQFNDIKIKDIVANVDTKAIKGQAKEAIKIVKEAFDPNDTSGIKINGIKKEITGISNKFKKLTGEKLDLGNATELSKYKEKIQQIQQETKKTNYEMFKGVRYNPKSIENYINAWSESKNKISDITSQSPNITKRKITRFHRKSRCFRRKHTKFKHMGYIKN